MLSVCAEHLRSRWMAVTHREGGAVKRDGLREGMTEHEGRAFCVTFDDGYEDTLPAALPVLQDLQIPATVYLRDHDHRGHRAADLVPCRRR